MTGYAPRLGFALNEARGRTRGTALFISLADGRAEPCRTAGGEAATLPAPRSVPHSRRQSRDSSRARLSPAQPAAKPRLFPRDSVSKKWDKSQRCYERWGEATARRQTTTRR